MEFRPHFGIGNLPDAEWFHIRSVLGGDFLPLNVRRLSTDLWPIERLFRDRRSYCGGIGLLCDGINHLCFGPVLLSPSMWPIHSRSGWRRDHYPGTDHLCRNDPSETSAPVVFAHPPCLGNWHYRRTFPWEWSGPSDILPMGLLGQCSFLRAELGRSPVWATVAKR